MKKALCITALTCFAIVLGAPAFADTYPVSGRWSQSASTEKGPIDCSKLRVISFNGNQRTDSNSGIPTYRNRTVRSVGAGQYRVEDEFTTETRSPTFTPTIRFAWSVPRRWR